jgi:ATP-binding cassette, subfamily C, bacterial exporter for protease/lipase
MLKSIFSREDTEIGHALFALRRHFIFAAVFTGAINLLYLSSPLYLMQVYNRVLVTGSVTTLLLLTFMLAIALLTMATVDAFRARLLARCGLKLDSRLSGLIFDALIQRSARSGATKTAHDLRLFDQFRGFITGPAICIAFDTPWIPLYLLLLFIIHPLLGLVAAFGCLLLLGMAALNEWLTRDMAQLAETASNQSYAFTDNLLQHADVLEAMGMQDAVRKHWGISRRQMMANLLQGADQNGLMAAMTRFTRLMLQSIMLGTGAWLAIDHEIQPATIFAASIIMGRALVPVEQAVYIWKQFISARSGFAVIQNLLSQEPAKPAHICMMTGGDMVKAYNLVFSLPDRPEPVINNMSFTLGKGRVVGLIGPSGSGKSTLARLIVGALLPQAGGIALDGIARAHWTPELMRQKIGYLPQNIGLLAGTVRDNIARFSEASAEDTVNAARKAGVHDFIMTLPRHYDTVLGPNGVGLSGGQQQRIALARTLMGTPSLVVLDEPNANLDKAGEEALRQAIMTLKSLGVTTLLVTHRAPILELADDLMVVRDGKLDIFGTPQEVSDAIKSGAIRPPGL